MTATIKIYDPNTGAAVYDPVTGTYTTAPTSIYTGKARVQPVRGARATAIAGNDTFTQVVLVSIPIDAGKLLDLRPKHRMQVTAAPLNPTLTAYLFAVQEVRQTRLSARSTAPPTSKRWWPNGDGVAELRPERTVYLAQRAQDRHGTSSR